VRPLCNWVTDLRTQWPAGSIGQVQLEVFRRRESRPVANQPAGPDSTSMGPLRLLHREQAHAKWTSPRSCGMEGCTGRALAGIVIGSRACTHCALPPIATVCSTLASDGPARAASKRIVGLEALPGSMAAHPTRPAAEIPSAPHRRVLAKGPWRLLVVNLPPPP